MAGLTPQGFTIETTDEIRAGIVNEVSGYFGISPDALGDDSFDGHLIGILSDRLGSLWQMGRLVYSAFDPDKAGGQALVAVQAIRGTLPKNPVASSVVLSLTGTPGTLVIAGTRAKTTDTAKEFATLADGTIASVPAWATSTSYSLGARRTNSGRVYQVSIAGISAASGGPDTDANSIQDGNVTWRFLGDGTGVVDVQSASVELDRILAISGAIREISTPVGGWAGVINILDADPGVGIEVDESLRQRGEREIGGSGSGRLEALQAKLGRLQGVSAATVFQNVGDSPDAFGVPAHAFEALVSGGDNQEILDTIRANMVGGTRPFGSVTGTSSDSQGNSHTIQYSRPENVLIYIRVELVKNRLTYGGDISVADAIVAFGDAQPAGRDVDPDAISSAIFTVPGVLRLVRDAGVPRLFVGISPSPTGTAGLPMSLRQQALYDTSRIVVISSDGTL